MTRLLVGSTSSTRRNGRYEHVDAVSTRPAVGVELNQPSLLERRFRELVRQWKDATRFTSSITEMGTHPAYQQIVGMGREALPLLLQELEREPDHWFWALKAITGEDPVPAADRGNVRRMTSAWLDWARTRGYLPT